MWCQYGRSDVVYYLRNWMKTWENYTHSAEQRLFRCCNVIHSISQADISALAGRICVILVPFDQNSLGIIVSILTSGRCAPPKIYTGSKTAQFWAVFPTPDPIGQTPLRNNAMFRNREINLICADDWAIFSIKSNSEILWLKGVS